MVTSTAERIAVLEEQVKTISEGSAAMNAKLDELLHLRSKGVGAFWLASSLVGTGIIGTVLTFLAWIRG